MNLLLFGPGVGSTLRTSLLFDTLLFTYPHPGDQHRKQRKMLLPAFSVKHLREMTPIFYQIAEKVPRFTLAQNPH